MPVATPKIGVIRVGEVDNTTATVPVLVVTPVPPLATGRVPVTPVVKGSPVKLVATPEVGVPKRGVTKVGEVAKTAAPVPVSSDSKVNSCKEVVEAKTDKSLAVRATVPVVLGKV